MKQHVARTMIPGVPSAGMGGFGGLFELDLTGITHPVLVSGTDGVGTKLKIAFLMDKHDTVGIDCVAMCVNDVICCGAKPLVFPGLHRLRQECARSSIAAIVAGVAEGCVQAGCALVGGETAEMPGFYPEDEYDLAGFTVGVVDKSKDPRQHERMQAGDVVIALPSSRRAFQRLFAGAQGVRCGERGYLAAITTSWACTLGEALLTPTQHLRQARAGADGAGAMCAPSATSPAAASMRTSPARWPRAARRSIEKKSRPNAAHLPRCCKRWAKFPSATCSTPSTWAWACAVVVPGDRADEAVRILQRSGRGRVHPGRDREAAEKGVELC